MRTVRFAQSNCVSGRLARIKGTTRADRAGSRRRRSHGGGLPGDLDAAEPACNLLKRAPLLVGLQGEAFDEPRLRRMLRNHGEAVPKTVAAVGDKRDEGLSRQVVLGQ